MKPATCNFKLKQGDDYTLPVKRLDEAGTPTDFTGWTWKLSLKRDYLDATIEAISLTSSDSDIVFTTPWVYSSFPKAKTVLLSGTYFYDLRGTSPAGKVSTLLQGTIEVTPQITEL